MSTPTGGAGAPGAARSGGSRRGVATADGRRSAFRVLAGNDLAPPFHRPPGYRAVSETETEPFGTTATERPFLRTAERSPDGGDPPATDHSADGSPD